KLLDAKPSTVHENGATPGHRFEPHHSTEGYEAVKIGVSFPAFFFDWMWACCVRLWSWAGGLCLLSLAIGVLGDALEELFLPLWLGYVIFKVWSAWKKAYVLRRDDLVARGYALASSVKASSRGQTVQMVTAEGEEGRLVL
ncbi:MAG: hypothetical protein OXP66_14905, partial [Candidatus Tectomicrobia bacterium]|nr:hypothetical protein [Candidatus Tectomicrobia bacterium]